MNCQWKFKKLLVASMVAVALPLWPLASHCDDDTGSSFKEFIEKPELREFLAAMLEVRAVYYVGKNIVPIATSALPVLNKTGPLLGDVSAGIAPLGVITAGVVENNVRLKHYYEMMWGTFLNDPKLLGPSRNHPEISYARDVFNEATTMVNKAFQQEGINFQVDPTHVFVSETWDPLNFHGNSANIHSQQKCGLWGQGICPPTGEKTNFFVPITDFAFGNVVERVALDIASQALFFYWPKKLSDYAATHRDDGSNRPWYSYLDGDNGISPTTASVIYAAQILHLPQPELSLEASDKIFDQAFQKYLEGFNNRMENAGIPDDQSAREKKFLSFRIQKYPTTLKGSQSGAGTLTPCQIDGQESLFIYPIPTCHTLHIKDISDDPKIQEIYEGLLKTSLTEKATRQFRAEFWPVQADLLMILLTDGLIGSRLSKYMEGANLIKKGALGAVRFVALPAGTVYATDKTISVIVKGKKYDLDTKDIDPDLLVSVAMLITQSHYLQVDPDDPNYEKHEKILEEQFHRLLLKADPQITSVLNQIVNSH